MSSGGRESRWPEFAALRALMARDAAAAGGRELRPQQQPGWRGGREDRAAAAAAGGNGKTAKVMHLLLWGPK
ncbi:hypothetical protein BAE44_0020720 [Dichanthelium oligosanthes]|uniref:Uncharacterized protein n=1 Tax=Dichanthelium oligosanthes TaxID=888268 RepID=A0A1E5UZQ0_9POAL|nr:hypothetical protein BAE44_0020720 [Dichanthelium oligosanthes]